MGADNPPTGIYEIRDDWSAHHPGSLYRHRTDSTFPDDWGAGLAALIYKRGKLLKNYRPIALLNAVYEIWATIMTNRISHILNLLTKDNQCARKGRGSTKYAIFYAKQQFAEMEITGRISLGLSKAFGGVNRNITADTLRERITH